MENRKMENKVLHQLSVQHPLRNKKPLKAAAIKGFLFLSCAPEWNNIEPVNDHIEAHL